MKERNLIVENNFFFFAQKKLNRDRKSLLYQRLKQLPFALKYQLILFDVLQIQVFR